MNEDIVNIFISTTGFFIAAIIIIYTYFKWCFQYWERKNVPYLPPSIPFGNIDNPFWRKRTSGLISKDIYNKLKREGAKFGGLYTATKPMFMAIDPEIIKIILTKDFSYFHNRGFYYNEKVNPLSAHMFAVNGSKWKFLRTKLTPTFTSGKMKLMFHIITDCAGLLIKSVEKQAIDKTPIDIKDALGRYTTDTIGSCAFGLECNSFADDDGEFRKNGKKLFRTSVKELIRGVFTFAYPELAYKLNINTFGGEVCDFFMNVAKNNYDYRVKNNFVRNDFFQLLLNIKQECEKTGEQFSIENIAAQCFLFFIAGFETSATAVTFTLYELTKNLDIQTKVREEIREVLKRHDGKVTYEAIQEMKYLRCVLDEALRMYPPLPTLNRVCTEEYHIPDTNVIIDKGTKIVIPLMGLHNDEEFFPEPNKFNPDRFNKENIEKIKPYTYLPFGGGPRNCLGLRFGIIQSEVALVGLLNSFEFTLNPKTKMPLRFNPKSFILFTDGEMWLTANKI